MARHKVEIVNVNTADIKVLNNEEMRALFVKMQEGDPFAREDLVAGNLKLVLSILRKFHNRVENMDDLFQVGCVGLLKAIDNFDLSHEVKFSTYAVPMILGEVRRYLRDNSSIRISRSLKDIAYKSLKMKEEAIARGLPDPSIEEVSAALGVSVYDVVNAMDSLREPVSMNEAIYNDGGDTIYLYDQIEDMQIRLALQDAIDTLNDREQHILDERFIVGKTQMEIADELMISQAQVSRLEKCAITKLKKILK